MILGNTRLGERYLKLVYEFFFPGFENRVERFSFRISFCFAVVICSLSCALVCEVWPLPSTFSRSLFLLSCLSWTFLPNDCHIFLYFPVSVYCLHFRWEQFSFSFKIHSNNEDGSHCLSNWLFCLNAVAYWSATSVRRKSEMFGKLLLVAKLNSDGSFARLCTIMSCCSSRITCLKHKGWCCQSAPWIEFSLMVFVSKLFGVIVIASRLCRCSDNICFLNRAVPDFLMHGKDASSSIILGTTCDLCKFRAHYSDEWVVIVAPSAALTEFKTVTGFKFL